MARIKNITEWFPIPHEAGNKFMLRRLTGKQLGIAANKRQEGAAKRMNLMGGDVLVALRNVSTEDVIGQSDELKKAAEDVLNTYDRDTVLEYGLVGWDGPLYTDPFGKGEVDTLDLKTLDWAAREIIKYSVDSDEALGK